MPFLLSAALAPSVMMSVLLLVLFYFLFTSAIAGYTTVALEFNPHGAGAIFGLINMGSFASILGPMTAGFMLAQGGNWTTPFFVAAGVGAVSAAILFVVAIRPIVVDTFIPAESAAREGVH